MPFADTFLRPQATRLAMDAAEQQLREAPERFNSEMATASLQRQEAEGRLRAAATAQTDKLRQQALLKEASAGAFPDEVLSDPAKMATALSTIAGKVLQAGYTNDADKLIKSASALREEASATAEKKAQSQKWRADEIQKTLDNQKQLLGGVFDDRTLQMWGAAWEKSTGQPNPVVGKAYSPALVQTLVDRMLTIEGKLTTAQRAAQLANETARLKSLTDYRSDRMQYLEDKLQLEKDRAAAKGKAGDVTIKPPTAQAVKEAALIVANGFPAEGLSSSVPKEELALAARSVASRASAILAQNKSLTQTEALNRAFAEAKEQGEFTQIDTYLGLGKGVKWTPGRTAGGAITAPGAPRVVPPLKALPFEADPAKRVTGQVYTAPDGKNYVWAGKGWKAAE